MDSEKRITGIEIKYTERKKAVYVMPNQEIFSIEDRRRSFEIRMLNIPANFLLNKNVEKVSVGKMRT